MHNRHCVFFHLNKDILRLHSKGQRIFCVRLSCCKENTQYEAINIQPYMGRDVKVINGERSSTMPLNKTYKMTGYSVTHILDEETGVFKVVYDIAIGEEYGGKCRYILPVGKVNILEYTHNDEGDI